MDKEIGISQSGPTEESQGNDTEVLGQTLPSQLSKKDTTMDVDVEMKIAPKENISTLEEAESIKAYKECEASKNGTAGPRACKEILKVESDDCEIAKKESNGLEECAAPVVEKVVKEPLCEQSNECEVSKAYASALEERVTLSEPSNAKEILNVEFNECDMQAESAEIIRKTKSAEDDAKTSKKEMVVIESVIQILPAGDGLGNKTSSLDIEAIDKPSLDAITTNTISVPDTDVIAIMDTMQKEKSDKPTERQLTSAKAAPTSLGLLSQYGSDSDETISSESEAESVVEVPTTTNKKYRSQVIEIESDSSTTISSDSESETESEYLTKIAKVINKRIAASDDENIDDDDGDADDDELNDGKDVNKRGRRQPPRVRGEMLLEDLPPIQDLQISMPAEECIEFGRVHSIVDQLLLVSALPNSILLDLDTVLFLEQGKRVLGLVFDVLGQVADPLYCVRFNTNQHIHEKGIKIGDVVYVAPKSEHTQYVILSSLTKMRGSDASWENDIEPPPRYLDYSDDEEEREARQKLRKHRRQSIKEEDDENDDADDNNDNDPMKRSRLSTAPQENKQRRKGTNSSRQNDHTGNYQKRQERFGSQPPYTQRSYHLNQHHHSQNSGSWHSHYNPQYHPRPPHAHNYRSPYTAPYQYQRPPYRTPPSQAPHFNPYVPPMSAPMSMPMPTAQGQLPSPMQQPPSEMTSASQMHSMPLPTHMTPPQPSVHSMPPPSHMLRPPPSMHVISPPTSVHSMSSPSTAAYVPNPFAFRSQTLSPQTQMQQPAQPQQQQPQSQSPRQSTSTVEPAPPGAD